MKAYIANPNVKCAVDGTLQSQILRHFDLVPTEHHADVTLVPVVYHPNFVFSQELYALKKPVVLLDYTEYGWDWDGRDNVLGHGNIASYTHLNQPGYIELDKWARDTKFLVHFKRELRKEDRSDDLLPCEFTCYLPKTPVQSREEFQSRQIEVIHHWGYSHDLRRKLHGEIFCKAQEKGYNVVDSWEDREKLEAKTWATCYAPHYRRWTSNHVQSLYRKSKIAVSLPGAGIKCFRSAEAPNESVMALVPDNLAWSYPWIHGYNCVRIDPESMVEDLWEALNPSLYSIYLASQDTIERYRSENYVRDYLIQNIEERL